MAEIPEKLDLASLDVAADKQRLLRQLFPEAFTETTGVGGEDRLTLDFDKLKAVLGEHGTVVEPGQERYGLEWPGKRDALRAVQAPSYGTLIPAPEESVDWDTTQNVFIEGDNLEVLKLLQKSYYGKVKMIYIDPPYNTGNDFVYPDNYAESLDTYLRYTGKIDDQGFKTTTNSKDSGRFHSNWLRMMYPRLYVAKNLLREDGVIFISIDDNEVSNLRHVCDQIFGEENLAANIVWEGASKNDAQQIGVSHEYILVYVKSKDAQKSKWTVAKQAVDPVLKEVARLESLHGGDFSSASKELSGWFRANKSSDSYSHRRFRFIDKNGAYKEDDPTAPGGRKFDLINRKTDKIIPLRKNRGWSFDQETFDQMVEEGKVSFVGESSIMIRRYLHETDRMVPQSVIYRPARAGTDRLIRLMNDSVFDFPKDEEIIAQLVEMSTNESEDALILDFFSGSATTAHAVMALNAEHGGSRRCISVQLPEPCDEASDSHKAGYKTIADIAKERIRRAGTKIREEWETKNASREAAKALSEEKKAGELFSEENGLQGLEASRVGCPDFGFRVFKLAPSNFKRWDGEAAAVSKEALEQQLEASLDHISTGATEESILFEILLKAGYELTCPMEKLELAGQAVHAIDGSSLYVSVADRIDIALIEAVAEKHPVQFICLDRALQGNDSLKVNTLETFRACQPEIQFRTV
jgi:adenine-specific DNA-methyltransferase